MVPAKLTGDSSSSLTARSSLIHATRRLSLSTEYSLQCRRFLWARECFCSWMRNFLPKSSSVIKSKMAASNQRNEHKQAAVARSKYAVRLHFRLVYVGFTTLATAIPDDRTTVK